MPLDQGGHEKNNCVLLYYDFHLLNFKNTHRDCHCFLRIALASRPWSHHGLKTRWYDPVLLCLLFVRLCDKWLLIVTWLVELIRNAVCVIIGAPLFYSLPFSLDSHPFESRGPHYYVFNYFFLPLHMRRLLSRQLEKSVSLILVI